MVEDQGALFQAEQQRKRERGREREREEKKRPRTTNKRRRIVGLHNGMHAHRHETRAVNTMKDEASKFREDTTLKKNRTKRMINRNECRPT